MSVAFGAKTAAATVLAVAVSAGWLTGQETKPVPKDSVRVAIPGCTKGQIFTAGPRTVDEPGSFEIREGMHLRMNGPKSLMKEIKAHEGSMIEIVGLVKKGQYQEGVSLGKGVRISPGSAPRAGAMAVDPTSSQTMIDVEGWRPVVGACRSR